MKDNREIIWLVAHYPDHPEMDERINHAVQIYRRKKIPIWIFASSTAMYSESTERLIRKKLDAIGIPRTDVFISEDVGSNLIILDTVQEIESILSQAQSRGVEKVYCVTNRLQLLQIKAFSKKFRPAVAGVPTPLKERRWWYITVRLCLIPLAHVGVGRNFPPLRFVRHARAKWPGWQI